MKERVFPILYIFIGLYCGFLLGAFLDPDLSAAVAKGLYATAILILVLFWRRIDQRMHQRHVQNWVELRRKGRWYFIVTRYVLLRGGILLAIFGGPLLLKIRFVGAVIPFLAFSVVVLIVLMTLLGLVEWRYCEQDCEILALKRAAQEARQDAAMFN